MKKIGSFIKNNTKLFIGFILGTIIFGGSALVVAGTVASSAITYTSNGQSNVQGALNDLYSKSSKFSGIDVKFWTDNYSGDTYVNNSVPSTVYSNYTEFIQSNRSQEFIRTLYINGKAESHSACLYYKWSQKIFCISPNFWKSVVGSATQSAANGTAVKSALETAMANALDSPPSSCTSASDYAACVFDSARCEAYYSGEVRCKAISEQCRAYPTFAHCD